MNTRVGQTEIPVEEILRGNTSDHVPHDLYSLMRQVDNKMADEYDRIQRRARQDPGTAGDQGEENWCELLQGWLPSTYTVVTKGRIISQNGGTSPQVDIIVLKDVYPKELVTTKLYLAAGVAAAFECKTTLKSAHIEKAMRTCVEIKNLYPEREGTPYKELHAPIVYGLLAHSHSWKGNDSRPLETINQKLRQFDESYVSHPRLGLDCLCVADLGTWILAKFPFIGRRLHSELKESFAMSLYARHSGSRDCQSEHFSPIGVLIAKLSQRLAWEVPALRDLADYYAAVKIAGNATGDGRLWCPRSIYSQRVLNGGEARIVWDQVWDEWSGCFPKLENTR